MMKELAEFLWDGLTYSGDIACRTATIVPPKAKQEMDKYTLRCLFYIAARKNIMNSMGFCVTQNDLDDFGLTSYAVLNCLCDLSYCTGVVQGLPLPVISEIDVTEGKIELESPYFHLLFVALCALGTPQEILVATEILVRGVI